MPTILPVTEAPERASAPASTVSPSTTSTGVSEISLPSSPSSNSSATCWPSVTFSCLPPEAITAYIARERLSDQHTRPNRYPTPLIEERVVDQYAATFAVGADLGELGQQSFTDPLAGHLDQAELGDVEHLGPGLVAADRITERRHHRRPVGLDLHVD